jgi:HEPN domain-containing protein
MTMKQHVDHWISSSDESCKDMRASIKSGRYLNALYSGHQSLEKIFKALLAARNVQIAHLHSVVKLANMCKWSLPPAPLAELLSIDQFYIASKYGSTKSQLYAQCTPSFVRQWTSTIRKWQSFVKKQVQIERGKLPNNTATTYPEKIF